MKQAVILCGGKATRLAALFPDCPKVLVPVAGRPFLLWQLEWLAVAGVNHVHLAAGYLADQLQAWLTANSTTRDAVSGFTFHISHFRLRVTLSKEPHPLGTGGGLKFAEPWFVADPVLVLNGDSLLPNINFQALEITAERFSKAWSILAVTRISDAGRYGTVVFDATGLVTAFREKAERSSGWVNAGVYLLRRAVLAAIPPEQPCSLENDTFPAWASQGLIATCPAEPPLLDMGTPIGLQAMELFFRKTQKRRPYE